MTSRFHPWRELRALGHISFGEQDAVDALDGVMFRDIATILLRKGLLQVERRCTLAHELAHYLLGHATCLDRRSNLRQELEADVVASRWLISLEDFIRVRLWTKCEVEMADELWVDLPMLQVYRESTLTREERAEVRARLHEAQAEWGAA